MSERFHLTNEQLSIYYDHIEYDVPISSEVKNHLDMCFLCRSKFVQLYQILKEAQEVDVTKEDLVLAKKILDGPGVERSETDSMLPAICAGWTKELEKNKRSLVARGLAEEAVDDHEVENLAAQGQEDRKETDEDEDRPVRGKLADGAMVYSICKSKSDLVVRLFRINEELPKPSLERLNLEVNEGSHRKFEWTEDEGNFQGNVKITLEELQQLWPVTKWRIVLV